MIIPIINKKASNSKCETALEDQQNKVKHNQHPSNSKLVNSSEPNSCFHTKASKIKANQNLNHFNFHTKPKKPIQTRNPKTMIKLKNSKPRKGYNSFIRTISTPKSQPLSSNVAQNTRTDRTQIAKNDVDEDQITL